MSRRAPAFICGALIAVGLAAAELPKGVIPRKHTVELTVDPAQETFRGVARIEVEIKSPQSVIWVNGKDLTVQDAAIEHRGRSEPAPAVVEQGEFITLTPAKPVGPGRAVLVIRYTAPLSEKAVAGPFRKQVDGEWYAYTVFTPIDARRAFPCFDEPRFKTPWEMAIRVRREHKAFANAPQVQETDETDGMKLVRFAATEPLPAEVVAFAVGPFDVLEGGRAGQKGTPVRVITPKGQTELAREAVTATIEILPRLERYTGVPYPWDKLDHIATPQGAFGATENAGLIIYQARGLLIPPAEATPERLRRLRSLQAHEIGHQWFGNLVTQADWSDVWLSEGFATWFASRTLDEEQPPSRKRLAAVAARERIMATDASERTQPVRKPRQTREELRSVYNQMVYQKGGAVLFMLENWLGEQRFQNGVQTYLKAHHSGAATATDLAAAIRKATGVDTAPVLRAFLDQPGIPGVRASTQCEGGTRLILEQTGAASQWTIPVCWRAGTAEAACTLLDAPRREIRLSHCPSWIYFNAGGTGYYRSEWTAEQVTALLAGGLASLTAAERLTLVYDLRHLESAKRLDPAVTQAALAKLAGDAEPEIARAAKEGVR